MKTKILALCILLIGGISITPAQAQQGPPAPPEEIGANILAVAAFMAEKCPGMDVHPEVLAPRLRQLGVIDLDYAHTPRLDEMVRLNLFALMANPAEKVCELMFTAYGPDGTALPGMVTRR